MSRQAVAAPAARPAGGSRRLPTHSSALAAGAGRAGRPAQDRVLPQWDAPTRRFGSMPAATARPARAGVPDGRARAPGAAAAPAGPLAAPDGVAAAVAAPAAAAR